MRGRSTWLAPGAGLLLIGLAGLFLATWWAPVADPRPLKMSCYWASRAVVPWHLVLAVGGWAILALREPAAVRALAAALAVAALMVPLTVHLVVPMMPHNLPRAHGHDLLAALAAAAALAACWAARPEADLDAALDALAADRQQPGA